ncbi:MAG TPA: helix-turn-helix transcriptional regulator, partial [Clostridia bacterium]|nr:helix-turn-helix transcriptional regulator [Clostridia bacterium]
SIFEPDRIPSETDDRECMLAASQGAMGYTVLVSASKSGLYQNMKSLSDHIRQLSLLNVFICAALIVLVVLLNYRPIRSIFDAVRSFGKMPPSQSSELAYIASAYSHLISESDMLSSELFEKNRLILDRVLENLISGKHCSPQELRHIPFDRPVFYVVNARRADIAGAGGIIGKNAMDTDLYAIEMVTDGVLCFVCSGLEDGPDGRARLSQRLHALVGPHVRLGFSAPCASLDRLSLAYTDALHALCSASENLDVYADECLREEAFTLDLESQVLSDLAFAIKNGNASALDSVRRMFAQISSTSPVAMQRYACIRLVESCRAISQSVGVPLDSAQIAQILNDESAFGIRDRFITLLEGCMEERQKQVDEQNSLLYAGILQFIHGHFTDPALCLNDIAEHMGVSIYTTSRLMKNAAGIGFRKYLNDLRIEYAKDLLITTQLSIQEIAVRSGFASASYFVNVFKKMENTTPNHYRGQTQR